MWDFNKGLYNPHKLFIQEADEILAISSNEAAFLEEIINRIIRKREPDIQSYYLEILENSDSPFIKKICIDILRGNTDCNEDIISKYEAGFKLCQAICLWHNIRYFDDEQIKNQIPSNGNVGKNKDAVGKLEKTRTKKASEKYNNIVEMLVTAEDENYALAYHIHLDVLDYYSSKNTTKKIKENLVKEEEYEKLSDALYQKIQSSTKLNSFDCIIKGIEANYPVYNLYVKFWYYFVNKRYLTAAKKWADLLLDKDYRGINYGEIYYWYSKLYRDGSGEIEKSPERQHDLLIKAYNVGSGKAAYALFIFHRDKGEIKEANIYRNHAKTLGVTKSDDESRMPTLDEMIDKSKKIRQIEDELFGSILDFLDRLPDFSTTSGSILKMISNLFHNKDKE